MVADTIMSIIASLVINVRDVAVEEGKGIRNTTKTLMWLIHSLKEALSQYIIANNIPRTTSLIGQEM